MVAAPAELRDKALSLHKDGQQEDCLKVLEESMDVFKDPERVGDISDVTADKHDTMTMLISGYLMKFFRESQETKNEASKDAMKVPLTRASNLLEQCHVDGDPNRTIDLHVGRGFHALSQYKLRQNSTQSHDLTRANMFFNSALKLDGTDPRATFGRASVFMHRKEWDQALQLLRQIIPRRPRQDLLKEVKFAMAMCFCGLERYAQMRNALMGVLEIDPNDVETLCALAQLDAYLHSKNQAETEADESGEFLAKAWENDQAHPVVLLRAAHSAFLVGMEMPPEERSQPGGPWAGAQDILHKVIDSNPDWDMKAEAHYQLGRMKHAQNYLQEAQDQYRKCRDISPDHHACLYGYAQTCLDLSQMQDAVSTLEKLREKHPQNRDVLKLLTFAYIQMQHREAPVVAKALCDLPETKEDVESWSMLAEANEQRYVAGEEAALKAANDAYAEVGKLLEAGTGTDLASPQMWNNLGTLRSLEGASEAARKAYDKASQMVQAQKERSADAEETKELNVAELTLNFNRAWLAESGDQPDNLQATSELLKLREEVSWYADCTMQLGNKWLDVGDFDRAAQTYGEASKQCPVLSALMQAHVYKLQGEFYKAIQSAEKALQKATPKQAHYVQVYTGNMYFEFSQEPDCKPDRQNFLTRALGNFMEAFKNAKDSNYAAIGIGMVFAQRGRLEFAKRTFQSVLQHSRAGAPSEDDVNVYINLGHTYLAFGGVEARKAIALYERARKLRPHDLSIRLYLARSHFELKEYEKCVGILSDALTVWPDNVTVRWNLALSLETWGRSLVNFEKKANRVVGIESGKDQMERAVQVLVSAANHFQHVGDRWRQMSKDEQKLAAKDGASNSIFFSDMAASAEHKEYCSHVSKGAQQELDVLKAKRNDLDQRTSDIAAQKKREEEEAMAAKMGREEREAEELRESEDKALQIMREADEINMPRNIGEMVEKKDGGKGGKKADQPSSLEHVQVQRRAGFEERRGEAKSKPKKMTKAEKKALKKQKKADKKEKKRKRAEMGDEMGDDSDAASADPDQPSQPAAEHTVPTHSTVDLPTEEQAAPPPTETEELPSEHPPEQADAADSAAAAAQQDMSDADDDAAADAKKEKKRLKKEKKKAKKEAKKAKKAKKAAEGSDEDDLGEDVADMEAELFGDE